MKGIHGVLDTDYILDHTSHLPHRYNSWVEFYRNELKEAFEKYPDATRLCWSDGTQKKMFLVSEIKAHLFDELIRMLRKYNRKEAWSLHAIQNKNLIEQILTDFKIISE